jgi:hypothetical protein
MASVGRCVLSKFEYMLIYASAITGLVDSVKVGQKAKG